jgi:hypothetical protein
MGSNDNVLQIAGTYCFEYVPHDDGADYYVIYDSSNKNQVFQLSTGYMEVFYYALKTWLKDRTI